MPRLLPLLSALLLALLLVACSADEVAETVDGIVEDIDEGIDEAADGSTGDTSRDDADAAAGDEADGGEDGGSSALLQFRGEQIVGGLDASPMWSCAAMGEDFVTFQFRDEDGNDVSVSYDANMGTTATLTLADGTTWNQTEDGVVNGTQQPDGTYRLSIQLTEVDTGETESMDVQVSCG